MKNTFLVRLRYQRVGTYSALNYFFRTTFQRVTRSQMIGIIFIFEMRPRNIIVMRVRRTLFFKPLFKNSPPTICQGSASDEKPRPLAGATDDAKPRGPPAPLSLAIYSGSRADLLPSAPRSSSHEAKPPRSTFHHHPGIHLRQ